MHYPARTHCPCCGGSATATIGLPPLNDAAFVQCDTCGLSTKIVPTIKEALELWDNRAPEPTTWYRIEELPKGIMVRLAAEVDEAWDWRIAHGYRDGDGNVRVLGADWSPTRFTMATRPSVPVVTDFGYRGKKYAHRDDGTPIDPPPGWTILPEGAPIPKQHREFVQTYGTAGVWAAPRRCHSTMTPWHARLSGAVRAVAVQAV